MKREKRIALCFMIIAIMTFALCIPAGADIASNAETSTEIVSDTETMQIAPAETETSELETNESISDENTQIVENIESQPENSDIVLDETTSEDVNNEVSEAVENLQTGDAAAENSEEIQLETNEAATEALDENAAAEEPVSEEVISENAVAAAESEKTAETEIALASAAQTPAQIPGREVIGNGTSKKSNTTTENTSASGSTASNTEKTTNTGKVTGKTDSSSVAAASGNTGKTDSSSSVQSTQASPVNTSDANMIIYYVLGIIIALLASFAYRVVIVKNERRSKHTEKRMELELFRKACLAAYN